MHRYNAIVILYVCLYNSKSCEFWDDSDVNFSHTIKTFGMTLRKGYFWLGFQYESFCDKGTKFSVNEIDLRVFIRWVLTCICWVQIPAPKKNSGYCGDHILHSGPNIHIILLTL